MTTIETHRFRNDTATRKRLMVPESFQHPAKGQLGMWAMMVERYSQPGDLVLDPMSGSGATLLAALMGRSVIVNELEHHFLLPMVRTWAKMRQSPMLGFQTGDVQFLWGDARNLQDARLWPYQELAVRFPKAPDMTVLKAIRRKYRLPLVTGRLHLPDASVGAAITSPPFQDQEPGQDKEWLASYERSNGKPAGIGKALQSAYSETNATNIGNLRNAAYWEAMRQVYAECWRVLKPGGLLCLVLKGFTRDGKYVDLPGQTETLLLEAGWQKHDKWLRELWSLSFWRILQATDKEEEVIAHRRGMFDMDIQEVKRMKRVLNGNLDERLRFEDVLAFKKPGGEGNGVDAVITSQPYESSLHEGQAGPGATSDAGSWAAGRERTRGSYVDAVITSPPYEGSEVSAGNVGNRIKAETWGLGHSLAPDSGYTRKE